MAEAAGGGSPKPSPGESAADEEWGTPAGPIFSEADIDLLPIPAAGSSPPGSSPGGEDAVRVEEAQPSSLGRAPTSLPGEDSPSPPALPQAATPPLASPRGVPDGSARPDASASAPEASDEAGRPGTPAGEFPNPGTPPPPAPRAGPVGQPSVFGLAEPLDQNPQQLDDESLQELVQAYAKRADPGFGTRDPKRLRSLLLGGFVAPMASIAVLNRLCDAETNQVGGGRQLTALGGQVLPELYAIGMGRMLRLGSDPLCCVLYFFAICAALAVNAAVIAIFIRPLFKLMLRSTPSKRDGGPSRRISRKQSFAADVWRAYHRCATGYFCAWAPCLQAVFCLQAAIPDGIMPIAAAGAAALAVGITNHFGAFDWSGWVSDDTKRAHRSEGWKVYATVVAGGVTAYAVCGEVAHVAVFGWGQG